MSFPEEAGFLQRADPSGRIAFIHVPGSGATVLWLGGYGSDMRGTKAERLARMAREQGFSFCRFDYSGHGESGGRFADGTISGWTEDAQAVAAMLPPGPLVLAGSSMGAWIALRLTLGGNLPRHPIAGLLLLAPAPDFTGRLVEPHLTAADRDALARIGSISVPSRYGSEPTIYTRALIEDGRTAAVMNGPIETTCPIRIIQGMADPDVPFSHALDLMALLPADDATLTLVRGGDHRLSEEADLRRMEAAVLELVGVATPA